MTASDLSNSKKCEKTMYLSGARPFPFKTIVAATDFSEESSAALRCAQAIARRQHAMLLLIHVIDPVGYAFRANGKKVAIVTDLGYMPASVRDALTTSCT